MPLFSLPFFTSVALKKQSDKVGLSMIDSRELGFILTLCELGLLVLLLDN